VSDSKPAGSQEALLHVLSNLGSEIDLPLSDEELIRIYAGALQQLLPDALLCVRLVEPDSAELLQVFATGQLQEARRGTIALSKVGLDLFGGPAPLEDKGAVRITEDYVEIFEGSLCGFDIPLHDGQRILGAVSCEYRTQEESLATQSGLIGPIMFHFSNALRNSRKLIESNRLSQYLDNLLDHANAPILVTDRNRRIKIVNQSFERLTGYRRQDLVGSDVMKLLLQDDRERFLPAIINALRGESMGSLEVRVPRKDGKDNVRIALSTAAITGSFGEIEGVVAVGQDLTELRQLQQQVIHSEKLATLGQLAAGVVHELNNPLTSISVYSEFLARKMERQGSHEGDLIKIRRICEGAERILRFTRDLMTYARPTGEEPKLVDVREAVERALVFCEHVIAGAGVAVTKNIDDDLPLVYGVEGHIQQVLVNLVTNACDAMEETEGELRIEARAVSDLVQLAVSDNGPGIPEDEHESIFEPFYTSKAEGKGTGLGLSIVKNIVTNHNGTISVQETTGGGATFIVELFAGE